MASLFRSWRTSSAFWSLSRRSREGLRLCSSTENKEVAVKDGGGLTEYVSPDELVRPCYRKRSSAQSVLLRFFPVIGTGGQFEWRSRGTPGETSGKNLHASS